jgi:hypothetical protein
MPLLKNDEYNKYYNCLGTFKMNREVKGKVQAVLAQNNITFQDFLDDACRSAILRSGTPENLIPKKIRKNTVIE